MRHRVFTTVFVLFAFTQSLPATTIRFDTNLGTFDVAMDADAAPKTVESFLGHVEDRAYDNTLIHRSVVDFVIQGGGHFPDFSDIPPHDPVEVELNRSNLRGTIALARNGDAPNIPTNQWFINVVDNVQLDEQAGGFSVFGNVIGNGMDVVDTIANLRTLDGGDQTPNVPVLDISQGLAEDNLVIVNSVRVVPEPSVGLMSVVCLSVVGLVFRRRSKR